MRLFTRILLVNVLFALPGFVLGQIHVNCDWHQELTIGGGRGGSGGGTVVTGDYGLQISVVRLSNSGQILWNYLHPATSSPATGVFVDADPYGSIAVLALRELDSLGNEALVLSIDSAGALMWANTYSHSYDDIPVDQDFDANKNTYVTFASKNAYDNYDYRVAKYDSTGTMLWDTVYNYAGLGDIPVSIHVNPSGGIIVCGASQDSTGLYQFATVRIDDATGAIQGDTRVSSISGLVAYATSATQDAAGNIYITGRTGVPGNNANIQIAKLNTYQTVDWVTEYNAYGLDDAGADIAVDSNGYIIVSGQVTLPSGKMQSILLKYDSSGSLVWKLEISSADANVSNLPQGLAVGPDGLIDIVTSEVDDVYLNPVNSMVRQFTTDGKLLWGRRVGETGTKPRSIQANEGGSVNLTCVEPDSTMSVSAYGSMIMDSSAVYDDDSLALFKQHELVVRFDNSAINLSYIDETIDKGIEFGNLNEFLTEEAMAAVDSMVSGGCSNPRGASNPCGIQAVKIFKTMRTTDTLTFTKSGDTLWIPDFYTMLLLKLPEDFDLWDTHEALEEIPQYVAYSEPNFIVHTHTNDPKFPYQHSINPVGSAYPNADVNLLDALDIYPEGGKSNVKIAVLDEGLNFRHEDFGYVSSNPNSGKMVDGWYYPADVDLKTVGNPDDGHGTPVAGIIGARTNDSLGTAGIAGGNFALDSTSGVSLYGVKILEGNSSNSFYQNPVTYVYDAFFNTCMVNSGLSDPNPRWFDADIINCSWGITSESLYWSDTNFNALREAVKFANDKEITVVASHGNTDTYNKKYYPSNLHDSWVISVGGSGNDGDHVDHYEDPSGYSCYGYEQDIIAPSKLQLVYTPTNATVGYQNFKGTSASAPHATGACGLMLSYHNTLLDDYQHLTPEDCEAILELSATDVGDPGYDSLNANGRLNIGAAIGLLEAPEYQLIHFGTTGASNSTHTTTFTQIDTLKPIELTETFQQNNNPYPQNNPWYHSGNYLADVWKIDFHMSHNIPTGYTYVKGWARHSSSRSFFFPVGTQVTPKRYIFLGGYNDTEAFVTAYVYKVYDTLGNFITWWPTDPGQARGEYSLLVRAIPTGLSENGNNSGLSLYPNPTTGEHTLKFSAVANDKISVDLYGVDGRFIRNAYSGLPDSKEFSITLDISSLPSGMYLYSVTNGSSEQVIRFIKK